MYYLSRSGIFSVGSLEKRISSLDGVLTAQYSTGDSNCLDDMLNAIPFVIDNRVQATSLLSPQIPK